MMSRLAVIFVVISSYLFFALPHMMPNSFSKTPGTHYQFLTAGFLDGHLSLSLQPLPELVKLDNPYDPRQNAQTRYHDASLYHGKYYLYFWPLPVLAFFMPFKLLTGLYAPDALGIAFFCAIGFLLNFLLLIKIQKNIFRKCQKYN
jgi:hypothetical protein